MGFIGGLIFAGVVAVAAACVRHIAGKLSEKEKRKQREIERDYRQYEKKAQKECKENQEYYRKKAEEREAELAAWEKEADSWNAKPENLMPVIIGDKVCVKTDNINKNNILIQKAEIERKYELEIQQYHLQLIEKKRKENKKFYLKMLHQVEEQYADKEKFIKDTESMSEKVHKGIEDMRNTYLRTKSVAEVLRTIDESICKVQAYLEYLDVYKVRLSNTYNLDGSIIKPFEMALPQSYPYEGKKYEIIKGQFINYTVSLDGYGSISVSRPEQGLFDQYSDEAKLPFMVTVYEGRKYFSLSKGLLAASVGGSLGIDTIVDNIYPKSIRLRFKNYQYLNLPKKNLRNPLGRTPIGSAMRVFITDYDYAFKGFIYVSEKAEDGYTAAQFNNLILCMDEKEAKKLQDAVRKNGLEQISPEWKIGPVWDENDELDSLIMQIGCVLAVKASFENIDDKGLYLKYDSILTNEDFLTFDDVFVTTNVEIDVCLSKKLLAEPSKYEESLSECEKFKAFLVSEFGAQRRLAKDSEMKLYLSQWSEITKRLIEHKQFGSRFVVDVGEVKQKTLAQTELTIITVENVQEFRTFLEKENKGYKTKYFLYVNETKYPCEVLEGTEEIALRVRSYMGDEIFLSHDFSIDLYTVAVPYVERQQMNAFTLFKEGKIVNQKLKETILNVNEAFFEDNENRISQMINERILENQNQTQAILQSFAEEKFFMIQGPPGTGKTTVIKELLLQTLALNPMARILIVSQANVAVDNVIRGIIDIAKTDNAGKIIDISQVVRCGTIEKIADDVEEYSFDNRKNHYLSELQKKQPTDSKVRELRSKWMEFVNTDENAEIVGEALLTGFQVIGVTCVGLESRHYGLGGLEFDLVIIDEAGKALPGELLIPINRAKKTIIIGDHKQLPPVVDPELYRKDGVDYDDVVEETQQDDFLNTSFFEKLYEACPSNLKCMLDVQFRMPVVVADLVNIFYDGKLKSGANCKAKVPMILNSHIVLIDMKDDEQYRECQDIWEGGGKSSPYNVREAEVVVGIAQKLQPFYSKRIVVITPYKKQKRVIINKLNECGIENVWVNTIDAFQGDEEDIVIYCTTRAEKKTNYFSDSARLNVALSRTKNTLIIVASGKYLESYDKDSPLGRISEYLKHHAKTVQYQDWCRDDFDILFNPQYEIGTKSRKKKKNTVPELDKIVKFEKTHKVVRNCKACGHELNDNEEVLCIACSDKFAVTRCECCGSEVKQLLYDKYCLNKPIPRLCPDCIPAKCIGCGKEILMKKSAYISLTSDKKKILCEDCRTNVPVGICVVCGKPINAMKYYVGKEKVPSYHFECRNEVFESRECIMCYQKFDITYGEMSYFEDKGLELPLRCSVCRKMKR